MYFSFDIFRRKTFTLSCNILYNKCTTAEETSFNSVQHVIIENGYNVEKCLKYFPNVNELSIKYNDSSPIPWFTAKNIRRILPLI